MKLSGKDFAQMLKNNPHMRVHSIIGKNMDDCNENLTTNMAADNVADKKVKSNSYEKIMKNFDKVYQSLDNSTGSHCFDNDGNLVIYFPDAILFSRNQTDTLKEQKPFPYLLTRYKKLWLKKVGEVLSSLSKLNIVYDEDEPLRLYLYRETSNKLYDEDNLATAFKYFIDGLRQEVNGYQLFKDDNQKIIKECVPFQVKSTKNCVAIKIIRGIRKPIINNFEDFLDLE